MRRGEVLTIGWRKIAGYLQGQQNQWQKETLVKTEEQKYTQVDECPNRCLINQIMVLEVSRA